MRMRLSNLILTNNLTRSNVQNIRKYLFFSIKERQVLLREKVIEIKYALIDLPFLLRAVGLLVSTYEVRQLAEKLDPGNINNNIH
jgi:hypothetical protein